jgi:hypothetical protein
MTQCCRVYNRGTGLHYAVLMPCYMCMLTSQVILWTIEIKRQTYRSVLEVRPVKYNVFEWRAFQFALVPTVAISRRDGADFQG